MAYSGGKFKSPIGEFSTNYRFPHGRYRLGNANNDNQDQIWRAAVAVSKRGDESCVDKCGSNVKCETCRDAKTGEENGKPVCQYYKNQCTKDAWFREDWCRKTCGTCKSSGKEVS